MSRLILDKYIVDTPIIDIVKQIKKEISNKKLREIQVKSDYIRVTCPVHKDGLEEHPSCSIYCGDSPDIQYGYVHCFTCGLSEPLWKFVSDCFDEDEDFGKEWLIERFGNKMLEHIVDLPKIELNKKPIKKYLDESILNNFQSYHPYMSIRKLSTSICNDFKVKYDPDTQSLVFPVWDDQNNLVMLTRRNVNNKKFLIPEDTEKPLYLLNYIKNKNIGKVIITEGQIDALTSWTYGFPAIATIGSISNKQLEILNKSNIRVYITMFDNDEAGKRFTEKFNKNIRKDVIVINCQLPKNRKDINDLSEEEFWKCLNSIGVYRKE